MVQDTPVVLMKDGVMLGSAMRETHVSEDELLAKLRAANVLDIGFVRAVVLETTGDVSVLYGDHMEETLLQSTSMHGSGQK
jgi:uncharacterized membrane protein YcaP (DUF421 family)